MHQCCYWIIMIRHVARCAGQRFFTSSNSCIRLASSTSPSTFQELNAATLKASDRNSNNSDTSEMRQSVEKLRSQKSLVSAAFKSLKNNKPDKNLEELLQSANTVEEVLAATKFPKFSQYHAFQALSVLADLTTNKKIKMSEYETDPRFIDLCKMINPQQKEHLNNDSSLGDLGIVLGVTGEDHAAKLVEGISFSQKIRVMSSLALKKRRSLHLLRALATNLSNCSENFNLKQAADVLYAMSVLNFFDAVLIEKTVSDICSLLPDNKKPAVVGSVLTSIGILKYKNSYLLNMLASWMEANITECREQDVVAMVLTLASVNHCPENAKSLYKVILPVLSSASLKPAVWLDVVWALSILNVAETYHLQSILAPEFAEKLTHTGYLTNIPAPARLKLLNVNAFAQHVVKNYSGPLLSDVSEIKLPLQRSRDKQILVDSVIDSLTNLLPTPTYLHTKINTDYGFIIDGECVLDAKCNPMPVEESSPKPTAKRKRIAVVVCDFHDLCRGSEELVGPVVLQLRILEHLGYSVMTVTHLEFKLRDKLVTRVKYLEQKLKKLAVH